MTTKIRANEQSFSTKREMFFTGHEGEEGGCRLQITIEARGITTPEMTAQLEALATRTQRRAQKIIERQEAPQQIFN